MVADQDHIVTRCSGCHRRRQFIQQARAEAVLRVEITADVPATASANWRVGWRCQYTARIEAVRSTVRAGCGPGR
jgi:hypothetical protein